MAGVGSRGPGDVVEGRSRQREPSRATARSAPLVQPRKQQQPLSPGDRWRIEPFAALRQPGGPVHCGVEPPAGFSVKPGDAEYPFVMSSGGLVVTMLGVIIVDSAETAGRPGTGISADTEENGATPQPAGRSTAARRLPERGGGGHVLQRLLQLGAVASLPLRPGRSRHQPDQGAVGRITRPPGPSAPRSCCLAGRRVWVHDYHLMLLPTMLKSRMPSLRVGWFLHTPFPPRRSSACSRWQAHARPRGRGPARIHTASTCRTSSRRRSGRSRTRCATSLSASAISCRSAGRLRARRCLADGTGRGRGGAGGSGGGGGGVPTRSRRRETPRRGRRRRDVRAHGARRLLPDWYQPRAIPR